jgi:hypothetical protein
MATMSQAERRHYPRVHAPILMRPVSLLEHARARDVRDISLGGLRTYSDEAVPRGRRLEIELVFDDQTSLVLQVQVAWVTRLADGAPAPWEIGLQILRAPPGDLELLQGALARNGAGPVPVS